YDAWHIVVGDRFVYTVESRIPENTQPPAFHLYALQRNNGHLAWKYVLKQSPVSTPYLADGMVLTPLTDGTVLVLNSVTGQVVWRRPIAIAKSRIDRVLPAPFGESGAIRKREGKSIPRIADPHKFEYARKEPFVMPWPSDAAQGRKPRQQLFETIDGMQLVNGVPRTLRSTFVTETLVMFDAATGAEQWRWQPGDGVFFEKILSDGHRIYLQDYHSIRAVEEGPGPLLPAAPDKRRELARFLVQAVFHGFTMLDPKKGRWVYVAGLSQPLKEVPDSEEPMLQVVKLGADSVPAVMEQVHRDVAERDKHLPDPKELSYAFYRLPDSLSEAMDLLTDIGDRSCVPGLVAELSGAKNPVSRMTIARALIQLGDSRAFPALLLYARTTPNDPNTRQDALFAVAGATRGTTFSNELTQYLRTVLDDAAAPASIRLFARFELLNDRGAKAREAGLAAFKDKTVPGKEDKHTGAWSEPETNEAGIFRAAVEALCQVGRDGDPSTKPVRFGGCTTPLVLPIPPGSHGVSILGHPGPVVFRRFTGQQDFPGFRYSDAGYNFAPPHIDLTGYYHTSTERQLASNTQSQDPYSAIDQTTARETPISFRDYFPYEISADGNRVRVGWEQRLGGLFDHSEIGFDIEVRKIAGRWYPVECRRIFVYGRQWHEEAAIPDTRLSTVSH
ncbi:MAG: hypothetical protein JWN14_3661, partial [Chthonomonadales bacterium]|nr:hypothetical protein [Chthonomonadales bacterium]